MTTNCPFFWGPDSIMMLPYMASEMCATGNFFARMVGINFSIMQCINQMSRPSPTLLNRHLHAIDATHCSICAQAS